MNAPKNERRGTILLLTLGVLVVLAGPIVDLFGPLGEVEGALCLGGPVGRFAPARIESLGELLHRACVELASTRGRARRTSGWACSPT